MDLSRLVVKKRLDQTMEQVWPWSKGDFSSPHPFNHVSCPAAEEKGGLAEDTTAREAGG